MNTLIRGLGTMTLIAIFLYIGLGVLDTGIEILDDLFYWFRRSLLPGVMWSLGIGFGLLVLFNFAREINRGL
jgi:hypothetical protein